MATYSRKGNGIGRSVRDVLLEAARVDGNAPHVVDPKPPVVLFGMDPEAALAFHDERCAAVGRGRGRGQSLRQDSHTLLAGVFSFPCKPDEKDTEYYRQLRDDTITWAKAQIEARDGEVLGCVQHEDEGHLHIHIYAMHVADRRLNAKMLHPGHIAKATAKAEGKDPTVAFKSAMSSWQQDYHRDVTSRYGLTRIGPGRRRLSRAAHMAEVSEAAHQAALMTDLQAREVALVGKEEAAAKAKAEATEAAKIPLAMATGMRAWADGEIDDDAHPTRDVTPRRRMQIMALIQPARETVINMVRRIGQAAQRLATWEARQAHRAEIRAAADAMAPEPDVMMPG